jgi:hypothetical protein
MTSAFVVRLDRYAGHILLILFLENCWRVLHIYAGNNSSLSMFRLYKVTELTQHVQLLENYRYAVALHRGRLLSSRLTPRKRKTEGGLRLPGWSPTPRVEQNENGLDDEPRAAQSGTRPSVRSPHLRRIINITRPNEKKRRPKFYLSCHKFFLPEKGNLLKRGISEIDKAFVSVRKYEELRQRPNQDPENANVLLEYLHLFDKMYFCGALGDLVYVEVAPRGFDGLEMNDYGDFCSHRDYQILTPRPGFEGRIRIANLKEKEKYSDPEVRLHHYLGTLILWWGSATPPELSPDSGSNCSSLGT